MTDVRTSPSEADVSSPKPNRSRWVVAAVVFTLVALLPLARWLDSYNYVLQVGITILMWIAMTSSWNILGGYTGYISLGHNVFFGIGAYVGGMMLVETGISPFVTAPLAGLVATILPPGGRYPWHYDTNELVVTIPIQAPVAGGRFEFHRSLRAPGDENLGGLRAVVDGTYTTPPTIVEGAPGDLQLFRGRYSLHRVTAVEGAIPRHTLVLSYASHPGTIGPLDRTRSVYGRVRSAAPMSRASVSRAKSALCFCGHRIWYVSRRCGMIPSRARPR